MRDLVFVAVTVGFFTLAALLVAACQRIVDTAADAEGRSASWPADETATA